MPPSGWTRAHHYTDENASSRIDKPWLQVVSLVSVAQRSRYCYFAIGNTQRTVIQKRISNHRTTAIFAIRVQKRVRSFQLDHYKTVVRERVCHRPATLARQIVQRARTKGSGCYLRCIPTRPDGVGRGFGAVFSVHKMQRSLIILLGSRLAFLADAGNRLRTGNTSAENATSMSKMIMIRYGLTVAPSRRGQKQFVKAICRCKVTNYTILDCHESLCSNFIALRREYSSLSSRPTAIHGGGSSTSLVPACVPGCPLAQLILEMLDCDLRADVLPKGTEVSGLSRSMKP